MSETDGSTSQARPRPPVTIASLVGAVAGIVLLGSLGGFLSELSGERLRIGGLGLSLMFEALGVVLLVLSQGRRASTAGVTLAALGTIPLVFFLFFDTNDASNSLIGGDDLALTTSLALLVAAALWLAGHLFGPSQSHALFLGAALVAVWLAVAVQVADDGGGRSADVFSSPALRFASAPLAPAPESEVESEVESDIDGPASAGTDADLRAHIEGDRFMSGAVTCVGGQLREGDQAFWACDGSSPYPAELTGPEEFEALEDDYRVSFDDLRQYGTQDAFAVQRRLLDYDFYDEGLVRCVEGEVDWGDPSVWTCSSDGTLSLRPLTDADRWARFDDFLGDDPFTDDFDDDVFSDDDFGQFEDFDEFDEFGQFEDDPFGPGFGEFEQEQVFADPFDGAARRIGWTTLLFGAAYLLAAVALDRARDHRRATAFFAVASPLLYLGISQVAGDSLRTNSLLLMVGGAAAAWAGSRGDRRFTAWLGTWVGAGALVTLVVDEVGDSGTAVGFTLLLLGLAIAAAAVAFDRSSGAGPAPAAPGGAPTPTGPAEAAPPAPHESGPVASVPRPDETGLAGSTTPPPTVAPPVGPPPADPTAWQPPTSPEPFDPRPPGSHDPLPRIDPEPSAPGGGDQSPGPDPAGPPHPNRP
jgi:hypothetical protein